MVFCEFERVAKCILYFLNVIINSCLCFIARLNCTCNGFTVLTCSFFSGYCAWINVLSRKSRRKEQSKALFVVIVFAQFSAALWITRACMEIVHSIVRHWRNLIFFFLTADVEPQLMGHQNCPKPKWSLVLCQISCIVVLHAGDVQRCYNVLLRY